MHCHQRGWALFTFAPGFQRPIHMYIKDKGGATPTLPRPHSALSDASSSVEESHHRLKSVVVVKARQTQDSTKANEQPLQVN